MDQIPTRHLVVATGGGTFVDPQNRAVINRDGLSVWLDVPIDRLIARVPADGRRPLAADRAEFERLYHRAARPRTSRRTLSRGRRSHASRAFPAIVETRLASTGSRALTSMRYLILTDIHANLEALETCLARRAGARLRRDARARRHRRLRPGSERRHRSRPRPQPGRHRPRQSRQGGARHEPGGGLSCRGRARPRTGCSSR